MIVGLVGYPLGHSVSPAFQQAAFDRLGIQARYELWETPPERLASLTERLRRDESLGANVTIPHKQSIMPFLDEVDPTAAEVGAVNTVLHRDSRLVGFNTDVKGFIESLSLDAATELVGRRVLVIGAGGAARAVVAACVAEGARSVIVSARRPAQAEQLISSLRETMNARNATVLSSAPYDDDGLPELELVRSADILVNATPSGTAHHRSSSELPVPARALHPGMIVVDLVYNPLETPLLREARLRGAGALNGLPMLIYQGAAAFELWTGRPAPIDLMRRAALEALGV